MTTMDDIDVKRLVEGINSSSISTDEAIAAVKAMGTNPKVMARIEEIHELLEARIRKDAMGDPNLFFGAWLRKDAAVDELKTTVVKGIDAMYEKLQSLVRQLPRWLQIVLLIALTIILTAISLYYFGRFWQVMN